jgi:hypothetical protein
MIKRDITETVYEYDKEGKLLKKTVTETHEEEDYPPSWSYLNGTGNIPCSVTQYNDGLTTTTTGQCTITG